MQLHQAIQILNDYIAHKNTDGYLASQAAIVYLTDCVEGTKTTLDYEVAEDSLIEFSLEILRRKLLNIKE